MRVVIQIQLVFYYPKYVEEEGKRTLNNTLSNSLLNLFILTDLLHLVVKYISLYIYRYQSVNFDISYHLSKLLANLNILLF